MTLLPGLLYGAVLTVLVTAAVLVRRWVSARLRAAERRMAAETWQEITAVRPASVAGWPDGLTGCMHFFGTDEVAYDPAADAAVYCEAMTARVHAWIAGLHQAA